MRLECDLGRADIAPFAWVVNQSLTPLDRSCPSFPICGNGGVRADAKGPMVKP